MRLLAAALLVSAAALAARPAAAPVNDAAVTAPGFPQTLGEFHFFGDAAATRPAGGVTPYRLNTPLWSDGAEKTRFVYVPAGQQARSQGDGLLDLPVGSALIKHFAFGGKLVETRVLLHRADGWVALPYVWNAEQTEARLALAGKRIALVTPAGQAISYGVPNKNQCKDCHNLDNVTMPIGPKAYNLSAQWLTAFARAGKLDRVPAVARRIPLWEDRARVPVADAARGYLDANCAHCHNPRGAASNSGLYLGWNVTGPIALGVNKRPVAAGRGAGPHEFDIVPGQPDHSILTYRFTSTEGGVAMPEIGRETRDLEAEKVVGRWIAEMR
ncbi:MAG: SO2930 family diheme c-type cytochrome [Sphingomonadaceae bacterium]